MNLSTSQILLGDAVATGLPDQSVDLVFGSPPYAGRRTYGINAARKTAAWVDWMLDVVAEGCRLSRGLVLINCAGQTRNWCYEPGPEGLLWRWWSERGGRCWRPAYWRRSGIPGSGRHQWLRADVEPVLAFTRCAAAVPFADPLANGQPCKYARGGEMTYRGVSGKRRSVRAGQRRADGGGRPQIANPGTLVSIPVGGGMMGSDLAHDNEAPFPQKLAEWFIRGWCPPGGTVFDPFSGSGTTVAAAVALGRVGIGMDIRQSQVDLGRRRLAEAVASLQPLTAKGAA